MLFLTSGFSCSLLEYWKAIDFGTLTLDCTALIYLLISSKSFGLITLDFLFWQSYHLWSSVLYLSSQSVCLFFSCFIVLIRISVWSWKGVVTESLSYNQMLVQSSHITDDTWYRIFFKKFLASWKNSPQFLVYWEFLLWIDCWILSDAFFVAVDVVIESVDVKEYINWFQNIEPAFIPEINPTWLWYIFLFYTLLDLVCWYFVENYCVCVHERYWYIIFL